MSILIKVDVTDCPRCGGSHQDVTFRRFKKKPDKYTHWTLCHSTGDPILAEVDDGEFFEMI